MTTRIFLSFFIVVLFASCSSSVRVADNSKSEKLVFGSGGGFTGMYKTYEIDKEGHVFSILQDNSQIGVKKLRKKQTREIFLQADKLKINQPVFNRPGNMTWFIKYKVASDSTEFRWGDSNFSAPIEIKEFYTLLNASVK